jgi:hypothetical protein
MIVIIIIVIFCPNIIAFCSAKLDFLSLQSTELSLYLAFTNEWNVAKKEKNINEWFILLRDIILLRKI